MQQLLPEMARTTQASWHAARRACHRLPQIKWPCDTASTSCWTRRCRPQLRTHRNGGDAFVEHSSTDGGIPLRGRCHHRAGDHVADV